jgi:predicted NUDIX family NTP pyrophosphohydrolase
MGKNFLMVCQLSVLMLQTPYKASATGVFRRYCGNVTANRSAGVLIYRLGPGIEVLLVHPGGPYWRRRDRGAWQIPKGAIDPGEEPEAAARREVAEEIGLELAVDLVPLGEIRQAGGKRVIAFAAEQDFDPAALTSNTFELEWPPKSGTTVAFPEVDGARWMNIPQAREAMLESQQPLLDRLREALGQPNR